jgi:hypothetical protein
MNQPEPSHDLAAECDNLMSLCAAMPAIAEQRRAIAAAWYHELLELTQTPALETPDGERHLDRLVSNLRRAWMATAHEHADLTYRSPPADIVTTLPSRRTMTYAYERSLEHNPLEERLPAYRPVPDGWAARHLLFSSGMASLSAIMQSLPAIVDAAARPRSLLVAAGYFETLDLAALGAHRCDVRVVDDDAAFAAACAAAPPDAAFVEPIVYDPRLRPFDVQRAARMLGGLPVPAPLVLDSTLVGPSLPLSRILDEARSLPLVVQASSGLKLDQAGLELANVGIVSLYAPVTRRAQLDAAAEQLVRIRRLNGTALTIDTIALLDLPFFLDPATFYDYCTAVFSHNARLARAVPAGALFETVAHPSLDARGLPWAQAPFVFFHLRSQEAGRLAELEELVMREAWARGLALERGGSFGFRGHRCEAVVLDDVSRTGVFKVALGSRSGPSVDGIIALLRRLAAFPTVAAARTALSRTRCD